MKKARILGFALVASLASCYPEGGEVEPAPTIVQGLRPIYVETAKAKNIAALPPQPIVQLGKIYYKDNTIYVNERNLGVHVINNSDPANPAKTSFLSIPGCNDIAIKGNILFADNVGDLIAVDISDPANPTVTKRLPGIQGDVSTNYPPFYEGYFECVDEAGGTVVGWETAELHNPKCWR